MILFSILAAGLLLVAVAASFGAAVTPWAPPLLLGSVYLSARTFLGDRMRTIIGFGLLFIGLLTVPMGLLTHGVWSGASGPYRASPVAASPSSSPLADRLPYDNGELLSYADPDSIAPVLAYQEDGVVRWASMIPNQRGIRNFEELGVTPLLWRVQVFGYARGAGAPAWCYLWRWGGVQKCYVLDRIPSG